MMFQNCLLTVDILRSQRVGQNHCQQEWGFVKRKCSTSGKLSIVQFDESKEIFLANLAAEVLFNNIPESLMIKLVFLLCQQEIGPWRRRVLKLFQLLIAMIKDS